MLQRGGEQIILLFKFNLMHADYMVSEVKAIIKALQDWDPYSFHIEQRLLNQKHNQAFTNPRLCITVLYACFLSLDGQYIYKMQASQSVKAFKK